MLIVSITQRIKKCGLSTGGSNPAKLRSAPALYSDGMVVYCYLQGTFIALSKSLPCYNMANHSNYSKISHLMEYK